MCKFEEDGISLFSIEEKIAWNPRVGAHAEGEQADSEAGVFWGKGWSEKPLLLVEECE